MPVSPEEYDRDIVKKDSEGAALLQRITAPTIANVPFARVLKEGMNGIVVADIPAGYEVVVASASGRREERDPAAHAASAVEEAQQRLRRAGATPFGIADVVDSATGDLPMIGRIGEAIRDQANAIRAGVFNGENAIYGPESILMDANVIVTMLGLAREGTMAGPYLEDEGVVYLTFNPLGRLIYVNSDGIGTKVQIHARIGDYVGAIPNDVAMKADDALKIGAWIMAMSSAVDYKGDVPIKGMQRAALKYLGGKRGFLYGLQPENAEGRIRSWSDDAPAFHVSGSGVSVIDEELLRWLAPREGDSLLAVRGWPNGRSNGYSAYRSIMEKHFTNDYHIPLPQDHPDFAKRARALRLLHFLTEPSVVLYFALSEQQDQRIINWSTHPSGGALDKKVAKPLRERGLSVVINNLFAPSREQRELTDLSGLTLEKSYNKFPMSVDGYAATSQPDTVIRNLARDGLEARVVGHLERLAPGAPAVHVRSIQEIGKVDIKYMGVE